MNKELKALEDMLEYLLTYDEFNEKRHKHNAEIIKTALTENQERIEELEETNHLMFIREHKNTKKLKALDIIKKKGLSLNDIAFIRNGESWETYVETMKQLYWGDEHLDRVLKTKEEYELLKEVLLCD